MIRKFIMGAVFLFAVAGMLPAQDAPQDQQPPSQQDQPAAQQAPANQQPSSSEQAEESEIGPRRHRPLGYPKYEFNLGAGANLTNGTTQQFVRGGGPVINAGIARNYSRIFGARLDFFWIDLPLRTSALQMAQSASAASHAFAFTFDPIFNIPVTKRYGGYVLAGGNYLHRYGTLNNSTVVPGAPCNSFWTWWGNCNLYGLPANRPFVSTSLNEFGYNYGGGIFRKMENGHEVYADYRGIHASGNNITTDVRTLTIGFRW